MAREMEVDGNSRKLMEVVQSTPETDPVPSPSRKRKGNGLSGDGATLKEPSADELAFLYSLLEPNPKKVDMSSNGSPVDGGSESCSLADDDKDKVGAMEEQASGIGDEVTLEMEEERLAPVGTDDVDDEEESVGLGLDMFDTHADPTPTTKSAAKLDEMDIGKSSEQLAEEATEMATEEKNFNEYISIWESQWGSRGWGSFPDMTTISSMQFAHLIPGAEPSDPGQVSTTFQVYSIKLSEIKGGLQWPLHVYGVVAVRDSVDHNRNLLFARRSTACQIVTEDDPYLCLIGPSRAIVLDGPVVFEIQLKLGASSISRDRSLLSDMRKYYVGSGTISFENCFCTTELRLEAIEYSVQATILGIRVKDGPWPSLYGGIIYCFAPPLGETEQEDKKLVLLDSRGRRMPKGFEGHLHLSRQVVSVEMDSSLKFILQTYSSSSCDVGELITVCFKPKYSNTTQETCCLGGKEVEITVAWSRLVVDKRNIALKGWIGMARDD